MTCPREGCVIEVASEGKGDLSGCSKNRSIKQGSAKVPVNNGAIFEADNVSMMPRVCQVKQRVLPAHNRLQLIVPKIFIELNITLADERRIFGCLTTLAPSFSIPSFLHWLLPPVLSWFPLVFLYDPQSFLPSLHSSTINPYLLFIKWEGKKI